MHYVTEGKFEETTNIFTSAIFYTGAAFAQSNDFTATPHGDGNTFVILLEGTMNLSSTSLTQK